MADIDRLKECIFFLKKNKIIKNQQDIADKTGPVNTKNNYGEMSLDSGTTFIKVDKQLNVKNNQEKASCFTAGAHSGGNHSDMDLICVAMRGREEAILSPKRTEYGKSIRKAYEAGEITEQRKNIQQLEPRTDGKTNTLTSVQKDNLVMQLNPSLESGGQQPYQQNRVYDKDGIYPSVMSGHRGNVLHEHRIRRLTPTEVARLQTVPSWYIWKCSDTQQYKLCGNGWTIEVIVHILSFFVHSNDKSSSLNDNNKVSEILVS